jgi:hypothetical protein
VDTTGTLVCTRSELQRITEGLWLSTSGVISQRTTEGLWLSTLGVIFRMTTEGLWLLWACAIQSVSLYCDIH